MTSRGRDMISRGPGMISKSRAMSSRGRVMTFGSRAIIAWTSAIEECEGRHSAIAKAGTLALRST